MSAKQVYEIWCVNIRMLLCNHTGWCLVVF